MFYLGQQALFSGKFNPGHGEVLLGSTSIVPGEVQPGSRSMVPGEVLPGSSMSSDAEVVGCSVIRLELGFRGPGYPGCFARPWLEGYRPNELVPCVSDPVEGTTGWPSPAPAGAAPVRVVGGVECGPGGLLLVLGTFPEIGRSEHNLVRVLGVALVRWSLASNPDGVECGPGGFLLVLGTFPEIGCSEHNLVRVLRCPCSPRTAACRSYSGHRHSIRVVGHLLSSYRGSRKWYFVVGVDHGINSDYFLK
ncbi:hypothetical protein TIFTF001_017651 [Ficus carica]|uniref:Uncharacterized protein n=1 Tax=Ficus carica TaxID=3494 RepID=A0AA88AR25_FICCA|nr:hypothetical protein TIFTF001_017651 [Ficus carica]